ncbi:MAG: hypothetical protein JWM74_4581 [Myxococcaceae bacterium]|nr:hypothetical protein [Myxococcaceae bacterium]
MAHDIPWSIVGAEAARQVIRWTARLSLVLLTGALVAPSFGKPPRAFIRGLGLLYVWSIFLVSYLDRALEAPRIYGPAIVLLVIGLLACGSRRARTALG